MTESRAALAEIAASSSTPSDLPIPLHDYVLIELSAPKSRTTDAGIEIPQIVQDEPVEGIVLAVGPGRVSDRGSIILPPLNIIPAARVLFAKYAGHEYTPFANDPNPERRKVYRLIRAEEILGVFP